MSVTFQTTTLASPPNGTVVDTGSGASTATGTQRVILASDQTAVPASQSGTWTVQPGNTANTTAWKVDGSAVTQPVSGTVTANIGTTNGLALDASVTGLQVAQGSTTSGQKGPLLQGAVTTAAPSYTTAQTSPLSLTTAGAVRVDGSTVTQPVSGTVTSNIGTTNGLALDASVTGLQVSQGSTTSGQKGSLLQGAVTTAAPSYTTAQTSPLSLTPAGALRTDASATTQPVSGTVTANQGGTWTVQPGNTQNTTPWLFGEVPLTTGGLSVSSFLSTAAVQSTSVKASAGQVYGIHAFNNDGSPVYVRLYNQTTAPASTDTANILWRGLIPANTNGAGVVIPIPAGLAFSAGIGYRVTAAIADNDATALAANTILFNAIYK